MPRRIEHSRRVNAAMRSISAGVAGGSDMSPSTKPLTFVPASRRRSAQSQTNEPNTPATKAHSRNGAGGDPRGSRTPSELPQGTAGSRQAAAERSLEALVSVRWTTRTGCSAVNWSAGIR
jgi:hypothetical protein